MEGERERGREGERERERERKRENLMAIVQCEDTGAFCLKTEGKPTLSKRNEDNEEKIELQLKIERKRE
jgi:hypothetical protein